ncbi:MAG TPA: hypothetical protein VGK19_18180 [Capsulimonadaceae bacterium]|jgi:hypothetical protein
MDNNYNIRVAKLKIRKILLEKWDPIGVRTEPMAQDEYDNYIGLIYTLLIGSASDSDIVEHIRKIETEKMGLPGQSDETLQNVVNALREVSFSTAHHAAFHDD